MKYLVIILCFFAISLSAQTTQPSETKPSTEQPEQNSITEQIKANKQKIAQEKEAAAKAAEEQIRSGNIPSSQPKRPITNKNDEYPESMMSEKDKMAKYGLAVSDKNVLGGLREGEAPNFRGVDQNGNTVELKELLKKGKVVIVFYRGYWCGICNRALSEFETKLKAITDTGANVIAVTTESNESAKKTIDKNDITFSVISDKNGQIAKDYKVLYEVSEAYQEKVAGYTKSSIQKFNNSNEALLPVPATYIVNPNGNIEWFHYTIDYSQRAGIDKILEQLAK